MSYKPPQQDKTYLVPALSYAEELAEMQRAKQQESIQKKHPHLTTGYIQPWTQTPTHQPADPAAWNEGWADRHNYRNSLNRAVPKDIEWKGIDSSPAVLTSTPLRSHPPAN